MPFSIMRDLFPGLAAIRREVTLSQAVTPLAPAAGSQFWVKSDIDTYQDILFSTPAVADGDPVAAWKDQSGNGNHLLQGTSTKRPLFKTGIINGKPGILGDGVDDYLATTLGLIAPGTGPCTFLYVYQRLTFISGSGACCFIGGGSTKDYNSAGSFLPGYESAANTLDTYCEANAPWVSNAAAAGNGTRYIYAVWFDGSGLKVYSPDRGTLIGTGAFTRNPGTGAPTIYSNARFDTSPNSSNGYMAEILFYNTALSNADLDTTFAYLRARYGI